MDGQHCGHANRDQIEEVLVVSSRRSDKPSRRVGTTEKNMFRDMSISPRYVNFSWKKFSAGMGALDK